MKIDAMPTICIPNKITAVDSLGSSPTSSSTKINYTSRNENKFKYNSVRNKSQLEKLKIENEKLRKQITEAEKDFIIQTNLYRERLKHYKEIQKSSNMKNKSMFTKQRTREILSKVFSETQLRVLMGRKKKTNWSDDDMAVGYTIKHLSNLTCYNYLLRNMNLPLPGISSIKRWIQVRKKGLTEAESRNSEQENTTFKKEEIETIEEEIHEDNENEEFMEMEETEEME